MIEFLAISAFLISLIASSIAVSAVFILRYDIKGRIRDVEEGFDKKLVEKSDQVLKQAGQESFLIVQQTFDAYQNGSTPKYKSGGNTLDIANFNNFGM